MALEQIAAVIDSVVHDRVFHFVAVEIHARPLVIIRFGRAAGYRRVAERLGVFNR